MVKLMELTETKELMDLWKKEMNTFTSKTLKVNEQAYGVEEALGHGNVYVMHDKNHKIIAFAVVHEGYFITELMVDCEESTIALIQELIKRYDELQIDLYENNIANKYLIDLGFNKLGEFVNDIFDYKEIQYEYLLKE